MFLCLALYLLRVLQRCHSREIDHHIVSELGRIAILYIRQDLFRLWRQFCPDLLRHLRQFCLVGHRNTSLKPLRTVRIISRSKSPTCRPTDSSSDVASPSLIVRLCTASAIRHETQNSARLRSPTCASASTRSAPRIDPLVGPRVANRDLAPLCRVTIGGGFGMSAATIQSGTRAS